MQTPYHRLARTPAHRWWRTLLGTLFIVVGGAVVAIGVLLAVTLSAAIAGRPENADGLPSFGVHTDLALAFVTIALLLPLVLFAARWIQGRPAGTVSSVTGRLRWRWLLTCLPVAAAAIVVVLSGGATLAWLTGEDLGLDGGVVGWAPFLVSMSVLILVVPAQAAAEEYVTRGWLLQAVGAWCRSPWLPITVQAVVFAALHGWGTPWGFADLVVFGAVAGWLTVRTGGLEAAIALHVANNLISSVLAAAFGELTLDETAADMPWQFFAVDVPALLTFAAVIAWLARRKKIATLSPPTPPPAPQFPPPPAYMPYPATPTAGWPAVPASGPLPAAPAGPSVSLGAPPSDSPPTEPAAIPPPAPA
ncbi:CPBP family intramembrane glutamic endopeptidase, partial [Paractinoplanes rishiriensis]|uniref:CPBP family intramembrane glutamic endopeptidase n=1 Tax=Paractinoplanes rishiriensis TaxID=1050105 RepID=UPI001944A692